MCYLTGHLLICLAATTTVQLTEWTNSTVVRSVSWSPGWCDAVVARIFISMPRLESIDLEAPTTICCPCLPGMEKRVVYPAE